MIRPIRDRRTFLALRGNGTRIRHGPFIVTYLPGNTNDLPRVAYSIGRHVGGAVVRNKLRRRVRAAIETEARRGSMRPGAYLIGASPAATTLTYPDLAGHICAALTAANVKSTR